jgi:phosphoesterase RecJ-like protein
MDTEIVACLYAAIASDTGSFRFTNTTAASHRIAAELHEQGFDFPEMSQRLFDTRTPQEMQLLAAILSTFELYAEGQISVMTVTMDMLSRMQTDESETENYAGYARSITGSRVAILFKEQKDVVRVSFRSRDLTDVHALAALFGGGGHKKASGAVLMGNLHDVKAAVLAKTEAFLRG